jgi:pimeloyl-ACP methyl ester carboxylesterase
VSHTAREEVAIHDRLVDAAQLAGDERALTTLAALPSPGQGLTSLADVSARLRLVHRYGGGAMRRPHARRHLVGVLLRSPLYGPLDKLRYPRGEALTLRHLFSELAAVDLFRDVPRVDVPVWFVHGRHDQQVPLSVPADYLRRLDAPAKHLEVFEDCAHSPLFEDPPRFHRLLRDVLAATEDRDAIRPGSTEVAR